MFRNTRKSSKLFSNFNTLQFASVLGMIVFVILTLFMTIPVDQRSMASVDMPRVSHPVSMPGADREDAMKLSIQRDGHIYFGNDQIDAGSLSARIQARLTDRTIERKVYIAADARARWGSVKSALDGVRGAGIIRVAFLVDQSRPAKVSR